MNDTQLLHRGGRETSEDSDVQQEAMTFGKPATVSHSEQKFKKKCKKLLKRMSRFERCYFKLALESKLVPERKRIDFVLLYPNKSSSETKDENESEKLKLHEEYRIRYEAVLEKEGFFIDKETIGDLVYVKLHCPFKRLCVEAERTHLEMPLKGATNKEDELKEVELKEVELKGISKCIHNNFETDNESDFESDQFLMDRISLFENYENPTEFFRPATRSFLTYHILINLDIRTEEEITQGSADDDDQEEMSCWEKCFHPCFSRENAETPEQNREKRKVLKKKGLRYLLMKNIYTDLLVLHENSVLSWKNEDNRINDSFSPETDTKKTAMKKEIKTDPRRDLDETWTKFFKFQPLWKIRNYFGEKIALYFAWSGELASSLWIPALFGLIIFIYGLVQSVEESKEMTHPTLNNATLVDEVKAAVQNLLSIIKQSFDNDITPFFALVMCLWGTIFLEIWKRKNATLAYEWDVDEFEAKEPDRPQYFGTKVKKDPVTKEKNWYYPFKRQFLKFTASTSVLIFLICLVLVSVLGVIIYRVIITIDMCPTMTASECLIMTTVVSSLLNAISILLLGKVYDEIAAKLTDWENHRTETQHNDALIIKLFAFQFVNSYASCFYIAFFRGKFDQNGLVGRGADYRDSCEGTCMSQLSFQVLILMLVKPFPKLFKDFIIPFVKKRWRKRPKWLRCCQKNRVDQEAQERSGRLPDQHKTFLEFIKKCWRNRPKWLRCCQKKAEEGSRKLSVQQRFLKCEKEKLRLEDDFTLGEYTEKVIMYGFLMLFAASFPLAPFLALITILIDIRVDANRMLWWYRRPVAFIAQDIGVWYNILSFVNFAGVLSNAFLIAFTSSWGQKFSLEQKLWIVIGFEHIVFVLKFILAYMIPDVPSKVRLAIRQKKYKGAQLLDKRKKNESVDYRNLYQPDDISKLASELVKEEAEKEDNQQQQQPQQQQHVAEKPGLETTTSSSYSDSAVSKVSLLANSAAHSVPSFSSSCLIQKTEIINSKQMSLEVY